MTEAQKLPVYGITPALAARIRKLAGGPRLRLVVVDGDLAPTKKGKPAYCEFEGDVYVGYVRSTLRVEVGRVWLRLDAWKKVLARTFPPDTPDYALADWLEEQGDVEAAALLRKWATGPEQERR